MRANTTNHNTSQRSGRQVVIPEGVQASARRQYHTSTGRKRKATPCLVTCNYQFAGGAAICLDALDVNDDGIITIIDPVSLLNFLFVMGIPPQPPYHFADFDPTADGFGCAQ